MPNHNDVSGNNIKQAQQSGWGDRIQRHWTSRQFIVLQLGKRKLIAFSSEAKKKCEFDRDLNDKTAARSRAAEVYRFDDIKMSHNRQ